MIAGSPYYAEAERLSQRGAETEAVEAGTGIDAPLLWWDWTGCFSKIGSLLFAITFAPAAFHSYSAMGERTAK